MQNGKMDLSDLIILIFNSLQSEAAKCWSSEGVVASVCNDMHISSVDRGSPDLSLAAILIASIAFGSDRIFLIISGEKTSFSMRRWP